MSHEPFLAFRDDLQRIAECVAPVEVILVPDDLPDRPAAIIRCEHPGPMIGTLPPGGATVDFRMRLVGLPPASNPEDDADGFAIVEQSVIVRDAERRDLLVWQFGPNDGTLQIAARLVTSLAPSIAHIRFPTGYVPLEAIVRALIEQFGITPRVDDWETRLASQ
ncbi:MAG: hypothetical protein ACR2J8_15715 [Thermomicrobiales bacterium]